MDLDNQNTTKEQGSQVGIKRKQGRPPKVKLEKKPGERMSHLKKHALILDLKTKGLGNQAISTAVGMNISTVRSIIQRFKPIFKEIEQVGQYRDVKSDILSAGQLAALKSAFSGKKLEKASFLTTLQGFEILNKAERLENNQSTENISTKIFGRLAISGDLPSGQGLLDDVIDVENQVEKEDN